MASKIQQYFGNTYNEAALPENNKQGMYAVRYYLNKTATINSLGGQIDDVGSENPEMWMALYTDVGEEPNTLITYTTDSIFMDDTSIGRFKLDLPTPTELTSGWYWIVLIVDHTNNNDCWQSRAITGAFTSDPIPDGVKWAKTAVGTPDIPPPATFPVDTTGSDAATQFIALFDTSHDSEITLSHNESWFGNRHSGFNFAGGGGQVAVAKFIVPRKIKVTALQARGHTLSGTYRNWMGIYEDDSGNPTNLLATSTEQGSLTVDNRSTFTDFPLVSPVELSPGTYWLGFHGISTSIPRHESLFATLKSTGNAYVASDNTTVGMPDPCPTVSTWDNMEWTMVAVGTTEKNDYFYLRASA